MKSISTEVAAINLEALDHELRLELEDKFYGLTYDGEQLSLVLDDEVTSEQLSNAKSIVEIHDAKRLTFDQQSTLDSRAELREFRDSYGLKRLTLGDYAKQPELIRELAQKIAWLELELTQLKGGTGA